MAFRSFLGLKQEPDRRPSTTARLEPWMNGTGPSISDLDSDEEGDCENTSLLQSHSDRVDAQDDEFDQLFETLPVDYVDSTDEEQLLFRHSMDDEDDDLLGKKVVDKSVSMKDKVKQQSTAKKTLQRDKVICSNHSAFRPIAPAADKKMNEKHVNWGGLDIPKAMVIPTALPISENTQHSNSFKYYGSNALVTDARPLQTTPNSYQAFIDIEHSTTRAFASHYSSNHPTNDDDDLTLMGYPFSFSTCIVGCFLGTLALIFLSDSFAFLFIGNGGNGGKIITSTGKPNIIFILSDDVGYGTLEGKKSTVNYDFTPFLRKLKEEKGAIYFNNYYSQEICTPARASLLTGKYPISLGLQGQEILPNSRGGLDLNETTGLLSTLLQDYGDYKTYMVGKWNLGHYQPNYLPTARGFDYFIGYFSSATTYWKKCLTTNISITDFIYSESDRAQSDFKFRNLKERNSQDDDDENNNNNVLKGLYKKYSESPYESAHPQTSYSTFQYRDIAIEWIKSHDYSQNPLFLYLAFQGSHRPYTDVGKYTDGMPRSYISPPTLYDAVLDYTAGRERQQYALTVLAMDEAILSIVKALDVMQQLENTYLIYASDNGGCTRAGSYNSDLRGSKGSLFEGGTKVDALIYSPLLGNAKTPFSLSMTAHEYVYSPMMHVSDWLPTILELAGIVENIPESIRKEWDGYSHAREIERIAKHGVTSSYPREYVLYNYYDQIGGSDDDGDDGDQSLDEFIDVLKAKQIPFAIRNSQYKLMHAYVDNDVSDWCNDYSSINEALDDDNISNFDKSSCTLDIGQAGTFVYLLFDLIGDRTESVNLYGNERYATVLRTFYTELYDYHQNKVKPATTIGTDTKAFNYFASNGYYVQPWEFTSNDRLVCDI